MKCSVLHKYFLIALMGQRNVSSLSPPTKPSLRDNDKFFKTWIKKETKTESEAVTETWKREKP